MGTLTVSTSGGSLKRLNEGKKRLLEKTDLKLLMQYLAYSKCSIVKLFIHRKAFISRHCSLTENLLKNSSMVPTLPPRRGLLPQLMLRSWTVSYLPLLLFPSLVITPAHQTMSAKWDEIRKRICISTLPAVTHENNSKIARNPSFICDDNCSWLIFYFPKNLPVSQDIGFWSQWEAGSNPNWFLLVVWPEQLTFLWASISSFTNTHNYTIGSHKD